jgi:hypothetical protein
MKSFDFNKYLKNNPLLKENDFPSVRDVLNIDDIDYDMMDYFNRTNKQLVVTMKSGEKIKSTVGKFYDNLIFFGEFPDNINYADYKLQKKSFDSVEIVG